MDEPSENLDGCVPLSSHAALPPYLTYTPPVCDFVNKEPHTQFLDWKKKKSDRFIVLFNQIILSRDTMHDLEDSTLHKIEKGWSIATNCAEQRLKRICGWTDDEFSLAMQQGLVMLETVCTFVHGGVKSGQYKYARLRVILRYSSLLTLA